MSSINPALMQRIRQDVRAMHAYAVQDSAGMIKLDAMENPHRLPPALQAALGQRLGALALNRYPDARRHGSVAGQRMSIGLQAGP